MLFTPDKDRTLWVLQLAAALFMIFAPTALGMLDIGIAAYTMFLIIGALFVMRIKKTGHICLCAVHLSLFTLLFFSAVLFLWVTGKNEHLLFITVLSSVIAFFSLAADYFDESDKDNKERRMMYMLSGGGIVCAFSNFLYWLIEIVPFAKDWKFCYAMGNSDFLSVFMLLSVILALSVLKGNSKRKKVLFGFGILLMGFSFVMAKSFAGWLLLSLIIVVFLLSRKSKKLFFPLSVVATVVFIAVMITLFFNSTDGNVLKDVFSYSKVSLFGRGGGFWSGKELFLEKDYGSQSSPGILGYLYASCGIVGIAASLAVFLRVVLHFIKLKSWTGFINVPITVMLFLFPMSGSLSPLFLWAGLTAYNENKAFIIQKRNFRAEVLEKLIYFTGITIVIAAFLLLQNIMVFCADKSFDKKDYKTSYNLYNIAASVNVLDSESCRKAALSLCYDNASENNFEIATELIKKALKRDKNASRNMESLALIYEKNEKYDLSVQEYMHIASKVKVKNQYNLKAAEGLYKIIEKSPKGSVEARSCYDRIINLAEKTTDLDYKEKINNIADKALVYTKGELDVERES